MLMRRLFIGRSAQYEGEREEDVGGGDGESQRPNPVV